MLQIDREGNGETDSLMVSEKSISRRPIEQLDIIKDINSLVVLSGASSRLHRPVTVVAHLSPRF